MLNNDVLHELGTNFIEYAVAVNTDRAIPNATDGLKPVAKRILYGAYDCGFKNDKPHVKCANIVGNVMADWHPHGDSSIYGALIRLSQNWIMRYPLIDFHGANGNIGGDPPAAQRYTEARLAKITEEGMLSSIKKNSVDFIPNYSETKQEPVELPSIFPNLLCNPNSGIGVAMACSWAPHNLKEVAQAIYDYMDGKEPTLPGPDFPTGGIIINKNDIPAIMKSGHGSVKIRGKYKFENNNIVFTEMPYGITTEDLMTQIGELCDAGDITGIEDIRNESNRKQGFRLVIECEKNAPIKSVLSKLFAKTNLQTTFSYNQVALVNKTPTELNLKDCIKLYIDFNSNCIIRECKFDINKAENRLHIIVGLLKALDMIDKIIAMIKQSESSSAAKQTLISWGFTDIQAQAILDMKLSKLSKLDKMDLEKEKAELEALIVKLKAICENPIPELRSRLKNLVDKYGDDRRTELTQIVEEKAEKEIINVEPEKCVVIMTEGGTIKRIPITSFKTQKKNGKGIKSQEDITYCVLRTNTIDNLMLFTNKGQMYRLLVNDIPVGTNVSTGTPISALITMEPGEKVTTMYSIYRDTNAEFVLFASKNGLIKKTTLEEYIKTKKKTGMSAVIIRENDALANVSLIKDEQLIILTKNGYAIRFNSNEIGSTSRNSSGVKGINLVDDEIVCVLPLRDNNDYLGLFTQNGFAKKVKLSELPAQKRGGRGINLYKVDKMTGPIVGGSLINDTDNLFIGGDKHNICISAKDITLGSKYAVGSSVIKNSRVKSITKI